MTTQVREISKITPADALGRLERGEPIVFVDARSPHSWAESSQQIPGSIRVPVGEVASAISRIPRGKTIVTYCT